MSVRASLAAAAALSGGGSGGRGSAVEEGKACDNPDVPPLESVTSSSGGEMSDDGEGKATGAGTRGKCVWREEGDGRTGFLQL